MAEKAELRLARLRARLILGHPFFGVLGLRLVMREAPIETMGVDGRSMFWGREFVEKTPDAELLGVICHEIMHCALAHHVRQGEREHNKWNIACDFAINPLIRAAGFSLPKEALLDDAFEGMEAEAIYSKIKTIEMSVVGNGKGGDFGGCGSVDKLPRGENGGTTSNEASEWKMATVQAANVAKGRGRLPAGLEQMIADLLAPRIPWQQVLARFITASSRDDYSWSRPNRRYIHRGLYLPGLHSVRLGEVVMGVDTSGSIDHKLMVQFFSEAAAVLGLLRPTKTHVISCDAAVGDHLTFEPGQAFVIPQVRRGGTSFKPVFELVEREGITPACLIYLTDLDGDFPDSEPRYPVLWVVKEGRMGAAPFGEIVKLGEAA